MSRAIPRTATTAALAAPILLGLLQPTLPKRTGILPGELLVPPNVTTALPTCGACHNPNPNANGAMQVSISAPRSLAAAATVAARVQVTGGPNVGIGGFTLESDRGTLVAGSNTRTTTAGDAITHLDGFNSSWQFQFRAPPAPGLVHWTAVGQAVDGQGGNLGDSWGFYGPDSNVPGVPFRMFVNASNVQPFGSGCAGSDGHEPILGAAAPLAIGRTFFTEIHNAPANTAVFCALGTSATQFGGLPLPFDLGVLGAPGCPLLINHVMVQLSTTAGAGSGGGSAAFPWPIPNHPALRGLAVYFQGYVVDVLANAGRLTATGGLRVTVQ